MYRTENLLFRKRTLSQSRVQLLTRRLVRWEDGEEMDALNSHLRVIERVAPSGAACQVANRQAPIAPLPAVVTADPEENEWGDEVGAGGRGAGSDDEGELQRAARAGGRKGPPNTMPSELVWTKRHTPVPHDAKEVSGYRARVSKLRLKDAEDKSFLDFFRHFYVPDELILDACHIITKNMREHKYVGAEYEFHIGKFYRFIGLFHIMMATPLDDRRKYWQDNVPPNEKGLHPAFDFSPWFGQKEFEQVITCLDLPKYTKEEAFNAAGGSVERGAQDPYQPIRKWMDALRDKFRAAIECGDIIVHDESMLQWLGLGMPAPQYLPGKPIDTGAEAKTTCDGESGVMVNFEMYEGKTAMQGKKYVKEYGSTTATTLRLSGATLMCRGIRFN